MSWTSNIPAANDLISVSQGELQGNTNSVENWTNVNHVPLGSANAGRHTLLTFDNVNYAPGASPSNPVSNQYTITNQAGNPWPVFLNSEVAVADAYQLLPDPIANNDGYWFRLGKIIVCYGGFTVTGGTGTINLPTAFPNNLLTLSITQNLTSGNVRYAGGGVSGSAPYSTISVFDSAAGGTRNYFYIAIGN